jgi:hypothetical protein
VFVLYGVYGYRAGKWAGRSFGAVFSHLYR